MTKYFEEIESLEFNVQAEVASGFKLFEQIIKDSIPFKFLCLSIRANNESQLVLERIEYLINAEFDYKYRNPYDVALATYAMALDQEDHNVGLYAAQLLNDVRQIWWTRQVINKIQGLSH